MSPYHTYVLTVATMHTTQFELVELRGSCCSNFCHSRDIWFMLLSSMHHWLISVDSSSQSLSTDRTRPTSFVAIEYLVGTFGTVPDWLVECRVDLPTEVACLGTIQDLTVYIGSIIIAETHLWGLPH